MLPDSENSIPVFRIDADELRLRHGKLRAAMEAHGLDRLVLLSGPLNPLPVNYAANFETFGGDSLVVIDQDDDPALYVSDGADFERARRESLLRHIRHIGDLAAFAGEQLGARTRGAIVGLEFSTARFMRGCREAAGRDPADGARTLELAARSKTPLELSLIRHAASLADLAFAEAVETGRPGCHDYELAAHMEYRMRRRRAFDNFGLMAVGKHNKALGLPSGRRIEDGDTLLFEITPAVVSRNYSAQLCRTLVAGKPSRELRDKHLILEEAFDAAIAIARPGVSAAEIVAVQDEVIAAHGFGEFCRPPYMRARGHGFGIGRIDLAPGNQQRLEEGMAFIIHPNQYFPDAGYVAFGQTVIVTATGVELLSAIPPDLVMGPDAASLTPETALGKVAS